MLYVWFILFASKKRLDKRLCDSGVGQLAVRISISKLMDSRVGDLTEYIIDDTFEK